MISAGQLWGAVALVFLLIFGALTFCSPKGSSPADGGPAQDACLEAHHLVREHLVAPSTADFDMCEPNGTKQQPDGSWGVAGYVDSDNSYGAHVRSRYVVQLRRLDDGTWQEISFDLQQR